jgi:hypothetical protein
MNTQKLPRPALGGIKTCNTAFAKLKTERQRERAVEACLAANAALKAWHDAGRAEQRAMTAMDRAFERLAKALRLPAAEFID